MYVNNSIHMYVCTYVRMYICMLLFTYNKPWLSPLHTFP